MATAELPSSGGVDLGGVAKLADLFLGKTTNGTSQSQNSGGITTTGTKTQTEAVSQDAINATVKSIMEGSQGLAAVATGQARAGLYNSSTNRLLINDLAARAAAEGAKLQKTSTITTNETQADTRGTSTNTSNRIQPPIKPSAALGTAAGLTAFGQIANTDIGKKLLGKLGINMAAKKLGASASKSGSSTDDAQTTDLTKNNGSINTPSNPNASLAADGSPAISDGVAQNNPSAFVGASSAGSGVQDITPVADFGSDLTFDQTSDLGPGIGGGSNGGGEDFNIGDVGGLDGSLDLNSGGGDFGDLFDSGGAAIDGGDFFDATDLFDFAEGGLVTKHGNMNTIRKNYATGGPVDLTNVGLQIKAPNRPEGSTPTSGNQSITGSGGSPTTNKTPATKTPNNSRTPAGPQDVNPNDPNQGGSSGVGDGIATGETGPVSVGEAVGFGISAASLATGIPSFALTALANAFGLPNSSVPLSPIAALTALAHALASGDDADSSPVGTMGPAEADGTIGAMAGITGVTDADSDSDAASVSAAPGVGEGLGPASDSGFSSSSDGDAGASSDAGNGNGSGVGGNSGGDGGDAGGSSASGGDGGGDGGGDFAGGGDIQGAGTETSDSISANLSDGEYVLNAEAVKQIGIPFLDKINEMFKPSPAKLAQGQKVKAMQGRK